MKKKRLLVAVLCTIMCFSTGCSDGKKDADSKDETIKIGVLSTADSLPLYVAAEDKLFEKYGCNVELVEFGSASDQSKAMEAGELDGMMTDMVVQCLLKKGGVQTKAIAVALGATKEEGKFYIATSPEKKDLSIETIKGAKIAISEGTMMEFLVDSYFEELGLDINDVTKVSVPNLSLRYEILMEGAEVDAAILPDPMCDLAVLNGSGIVIDDTTLKNNYSVTVVVLTDELVEKQKTEVDNFIEAYNEAIRNLNSNKDGYKEVAFRVARIPDGLKESYELPDFTENVVPEKEVVLRVVEWMKEKELITDQYSYESIVYLKE